MRFLRRRPIYSYRLIPTTSAASAVILFLFLFLYFLAPSPVDDDHSHRYTENMPLRQSVQHAGNESESQRVFRVPNGKGMHHRDLWASKNAKFYHGCSNASSKFAKAGAVTHPNRFLAIATSGGLNQQRTGIVDAVVAARILNATLIIPKLDEKSFWKDVSNFSEIFNVDWFVSYLKKDVKILKQLPPRRGQIWNPYRMRVPRKCNENCYINRLIPVLTKKHAIQLTKFDYRLANRLDVDLQKLRCRVNYHALKFTDPILEMGMKLVERMKLKGKHYIALHLRFEPDMLAFSGCYYGGGDKERRDLAKIRRRWKTLHNPNPDRERRQGRCPLTPEEIGLLLRALGYDRDTHIYVASGEVYGGEATLAPLKALFPHFYSKDILATPEELEHFSSFSSRMAALDFIVCTTSDVFVSNNNGNMAKILAGRRRYFGHEPTIRPNAKKLYKLFLNRNEMSWEAFVSRVLTFQRGFMGEPKEVRPGRGAFHENPSTCICENTEAKTKMNSVPALPVTDVTSQTTDETEWSEPEDEDETTMLPPEGMLNATNMEDDGMSTEEPELDDILSE